MFSIKKSHTSKLDPSVQVVSSSRLVCICVPSVRPGDVSSTSQFENTTRHPSSPNTARDAVLSVSNQSASLELLVTYSRWPTYSDTEKGNINIIYYLYIILCHVKFLATEATRSLGEGCSLFGEK